MIAFKEKNPSEREVVLSFILVRNGEGRQTLFFFCIPEIQNLLLKKVVFIFFRVNVDYDNGELAEDRLKPQRSGF